MINYIIRFELRIYITSRRHRCRKHPQQATLDFGPASRSAELLMSSSLAQNDYAQPARPAERPVIKKLVDNLQVGGGPGVGMEAKPSLRTDYPEFQVKRPVIHRLVDQLKTSGGAASVDAEFAATTLSRDQYRPFSNVKRPEGGRKLRSSLKVRGNLDAVSTSRDYQVKRDTIPALTKSRKSNKICLVNKINSGEKKKLIQKSSKIHFGRSGLRRQQLICVCWESENNEFNWVKFTQL